MATGCQKLCQSNLKAGNFVSIAEEHRKLSGGEKQMLALSRDLIMSPRLVLMDEPSLGLSPKLVTFVFF